LPNYDKLVADTTEKNRNNNKEDNLNETDAIQQNLLEENTMKAPIDKKVRVLIMNQGYQSIYHTKLSIVCSEGIIVDRNGKISEYPYDSEITLTNKDFEGNQPICIVGKNDSKLQIKNINRNCSAQYRGKLECYAVPEGIVVINELLVEEYLYSVVSSVKAPPEK